jgi:hypothetical protein
MTTRTRRFPFRPTSIFSGFVVGGMATGLIALGACSSGPAATGTTTSTGTGTGGKATTTAVATGPGTGVGGSMCPVATNPTSCPPSVTYGGNGETLAGSAATATIVDETGTPVAAGQPLFLCGLNVCSPPGMTGTNGSAAITTNLSLMKPAFKYGDALNYAEFAIPITGATASFNTIATAKLTGKPGAALTAGASAVSGDVTISLPAGASIGIDGLVYPTCDNQMLRAVNVPLTNLGPVLDAVTVGDGGPADFALVYGVAPAETTFCPAATVTVALSHTTMMPNDLGWAPGTAVEFWVMTTNTAQTYAPYGGWAKMSDGAVSADGTSVATVAGQGFILLENFAIRLKS